MTKTEQELLREWEDASDAERSPMTEKKWLYEARFAWRLDDRYGEENLLRLDSIADFIQENASKRKLRLFAAACCRRIEHLLTDCVGRQAIEMAERIADGERTGVQVLELANSVWGHAFFYIDQGDEEKREYRVGYHGLSAVYDSLQNVFPPTRRLTECKPNVKKVAIQAAWATAHFQRSGDDEIDWAAFCQECKEQLSLLYDLFPNPFRPITIDPRWLTSTVVDLANTIYQDRAWDRMPLLADTLMDAGCDCEEIIAHCRSDGPHVRGCWVVDQLLGKK